MTPGERPVFVGALDLGGTKILGGVFRLGRERAPVARRRVDTPVAEGPAAVIGRMAGLLLELASAAGAGVSGLAAVGVASPGPLDSRTGVVIHAPNLFWHDVHLADELRRRLEDGGPGGTVVVDNDANLAALAEWTARNGDLAVQPSRRPFAPDPLLYVGVGTGVGGGIVTRGEILHGYRDAAGEVGHLTVVPDAAGALRCNCGNRGCLETVASGSALDRLVRRSLGEAATAADLAALLATGDAAAGAVLAEFARWLGLGLASAAAVLDPEIIVVGGGVAGLGPAFLEAVRSEMAGRLMPGTWGGEVPRLEPARFGEDAGLVGAAILADRSLTPAGAGT